MTGQRNKEQGTRNKDKGQRTKQGSRYKVKGARQNTLNLVPVFLPDTVKGVFTSVDG